MSEIGREFQKGTEYHRGELPLVKLDWVHKPDRYKQYGKAKSIALPSPQRRGGAPLWDVLKRRRSIRKYKPKPLTLLNLSQLLWASQGITERKNELRASPSAGALYPNETYMIGNDVEELAKGIYHYSVKDHRLELLREGDFGKEAGKAALDQGFAGNAPVLFVMSAVFARSLWKYGERGYRYVYMDAAHAAQNLVTAASALGLGSCLVGALYDGECNELLELDGTEESVIYMCSVGYP